MKSNLKYEFFQAHCLDDDGILDGDIGTDYGHPHGDSQAAMLHAQVGEMAFIDLQSMREFFEGPPLLVGALSGANDVSFFCGRRLSRSDLSCGIYSNVDEDYLGLLCNPHFCVLV